MSAEAVHSEIIEPMQRAFLPPRAMPEDQQIAALREYADALGEFDQVDLKASWQAVRDSHTTRAWPAIAAFVLNARQSRKDRGGPAPRSAYAGRDGSEQWAAWERVRRSNMAATAAREGCSWSLKCLVLQDGKVGDQIDLRELIAAKRRAAETAHKLQHGGLVRHRDQMLDLAEYPSPGEALRLWHQQLVREAETAEEVWRYQGQAAA